MHALEPSRWAIYFARGLVSGLTKIGCSRRPDLRAQTLALEVREPVEFFAAYRSQALRMSEEGALHRRFAHLADPSRGREWYRDDGSIAAFVASLPEAARGSFTRRPGIKSKRGPSLRGLLPSFIVRPVLLAGFRAGVA